MNKTKLNLLLVTSLTLISSLPVSASNSCNRRAQEIYKGEVFNQNFSDENLLGLLVSGSSMTKAGHALYIADYMLSNADMNKLKPEEADDLSKVIYRVQEQVDNQKSQLDALKYFLECKGQLPTRFGN